MKPRPLTPKQMRFLTLLAESGGKKYTGELCEETPVRRDTHSEWRRNPKFKAAEEEIKSHFGDDFQNLSKDRYGIGDKKLAIWINHFERHQDHVAACDFVNLRWATVKKRLAENPKAMDVYEQLEEERNLKMRDVIFDNAAKGNHAAARSYLAGHDPRYSPRAARERAKDGDGGQKIGDAIVEQRKRDWLAQWTDEEPN